MASLYREVTRMLSQAGYDYLRPGKGDHQVWQHKESGKKVVVDASINSRHTANAVLKQARLPKSF